MTSISRILLASLGQNVLVACKSMCGDASNPAVCLGIKDKKGNQTCSWLMMSGSCADASSKEAMSSPPDCCASQAEGSSCGHFSADLHDGMCSVPSEQNVQAGLTLEEMDHHLHFAFAIYHSESEVTQWSCGCHCDAVTGLSDIHYVKKIGLTDNIEHAVLVAYDPTLAQIIVSFKGTDNNAAFIENWMTNLDFFKKKPLSQYPDANVHGGFWDAWLSLKDDTLSAINSVKAAHSGLNKVRVTGHSLGAAMATNAAMDLKLNYGFTTSVVNFGSPRAGDFNYHNALLAEVPHWRVTHNNDLVVHTPPKINGFYHASTEIHFPERTGLEFRVCDGSGEDSSCADACSYYLTCTSIDDHMHYLDQTPSCSSSSLVV